MPGKCSTCWLPTACLVRTVEELRRSTTARTCGTQDQTWLKNIKEIKVRIWKSLDYETLHFDTTMGLQNWLVLRMPWLMWDWMCIFCWADFGEAHGSTKSKWPKATRCARHSNQPGLQRAGQARQGWTHSDLDSSLHMPWFCCSSCSWHGEGLGNKISPKPTKTPFSGNGPTDPNSSW